MEVIENFIHSFCNRTDTTPEEVKELFLNGNCFHFVTILENVFPGGKRVYDPINIHFLYEHHGHYFDITGEVFDNCEFFEDWDKVDTLLRDRLIKNCCYLLDSTK